MSYVITFPSEVKLGPRKKFILNLNHYRNTHYFQLNKAKVEFKKLIQDQLNRLPEFSHIKIIYTYYPKDQRKVDIANVLSVADKFFSDALVESSKLKDDNYDFLPEVTYRIGTIQKAKKASIEAEIVEVV